MLKPCQDYFQWLILTHCSTCYRFIWSVSVSLTLYSVSFPFRTSPACLLWFLSMRILQKSDTNIFLLRDILDKTHHFLLSYSILLDQICILFFYKHNYSILVDQICILFFLQTYICIGQCFYLIYRRNSLL